VTNGPKLEERRKIRLQGATDFSVCLVINISPFSANDQTPSGETWNLTDRRDAITAYAALRFILFA
jgi:hypothetical protein